MSREAFRVYDITYSRITVRISTYRACRVPLLRFASCTFFGLRGFVRLDHRVQVDVFSFAGFRVRCIPGICKRIR
ncbi:b62 [miniopterid betaherpesvirus 1]|uniref:B62 n=1 Tax=miniopterid betaherpesvirus 1 TaxID=3070189 RepID=I3VQ51_9BETA|nr:b62 [miniopterid betaherpesvirus 1]AFK83895.1 b62 [miniopterid betaherpesvirus 1]